VLSTLNEVEKMACNMSFMLTTEQIRNKSKTVTRRLGWRNLKPGTILNACEKCQGLKKGERVKKLCQIRVLDVRQEKMKDITQEDVKREGFPDISKMQFILMFFKHMGKQFTRTILYQEVTRIEFEYVE